MYGLAPRACMDLVDTTDGSGNAASPVLPEHVKNYLIDIDGTVGEDIPNEEPERMSTAEAYPDAIETINRWYDEGHQICFFTARTEDHRAVTEMWLEGEGVPLPLAAHGQAEGRQLPLDRQPRRTRHQVLLQVH